MPSRKNRRTRRWAESRQRWNAPKGGNLETHFLAKDSFLKHANRNLSHSLFSVPLPGKSWLGE
jgi:hypothetical protein